MYSWLLLKKCQKEYYIMRDRKRKFKERQNIEVLATCITETKKLFSYVFLPSHLVYTGGKGIFLKDLRMNLYRF